MLSVFRLVGEKRASRKGDGGGREGGGRRDGGIAAYGPACRAKNVCREPERRGWDYVLFSPMPEGCFCAALMQRENNVSCRKAGRLCCVCRVGYGVSVP